VEALSVKTVAGNGNCLFGRFNPLVAIGPIHNNMWLHINTVEGCIMYVGHPESKDRLVIKKIMNKINFFYIITTDLRSFFYIIAVKIQALIVLCDKFLYACIVEICRQFTEPVFQCLLHIYIATHAHVAQKLLQACEQVKIT
jgi:hypothetical protein